MSGQECDDAQTFTFEKMCKVQRARALCDCADASEQQCYIRLIENAIADCVYQVTLPIINYLTVNQ